ncbi:MAG: sigma 54-interacting transcriptional regulator, partial [Bacteroidota bacterium]|nr:sigma 54-interacting transcriptional regulator [Bacteroidota bacterium]
MTKLKESVLEALFSGEQILQGMPELAYVFDKEGRMIMWNKNVEVVLGYSKDELYHKSVSDFQDIPDRKRVLGEFEKVISDGKERTVEYNMLTRSGEKIPCLGSGSKLLIEEREYLIGLAIDISNLKETEDSLKSKIEEIEHLRSQLQAENIYLRKEIKNKRDFEHIIGESEPLTHAIYRVEQVASMDTTVLLEGETGTGKELFARAIHNLSNRRDKPFIRVNCATLPASLIESELFGHEKGAFTGAIKQQIGRFELAHKGTIFLDEIGELPVELQPKLLRVLQEGEFEKLGNPRTIKVDARIIAATNRNLEEDIRQN